MGVKSIKTDIFTFSDMREGDFLYVDKTQFVWELVKDKGIYFLSRPRRFGKSLLLSTFDAFFQGRKDLFAGLAIEKLAPETWEAYPIVRLDMTDCAGELLDVAAIELKIREMLARCAAISGVQIKGSSAASMLSSLIDELKAKTGKSVVILIDEYDKPILDHLMKSDVHDVLAKLKEIYQIIKSRNADERFVFITGVTKFAHTSLFSGFNNPTDLTWNRKFATMLGYTDEELRANFADYIAETAKEIEMDADEMLAIMKRKYDGFCFAPKAQTVYNPVSVGKFFYNDGEFRNYWSDTGTPSFFLKAAEQTPMSVVEERRGRYVDEVDFDKYEVDKLDPFVFAVQTGYLTLKDVKARGDALRYRFDFPNSEVRETFARFLLSAYIGKRESEIRPTIIRMCDLLEAGDVDGFLRLLTYEVKGMAWGNLGKIGDEPIRFYEGHFRDLMSLTLSLLNIDNEPETRTADRQVDLVARAGGHRYVFELKCGSVGENLPHPALSSLRDSLRSGDTISQMAQTEGVGLERNADVLEGCAKLGNEASSLLGNEASGFVHRKTNHSSLDEAGGFVSQNPRNLRDLRETKINGLLDSAVAQARARGYYEKYLAYPQDIQLIALAFDIETRTLAGWRVERIR